MQYAKCTSTQKAVHTHCSNPSSPQLYSWQFRANQIKSDQSYVQYVLNYCSRHLNLDSSPPPVWTTLLSSNQKYILEFEQIQFGLSTSCTAVQSPLWNRPFLTHLLRHITVQCLHSPSSLLSLCFVSLICVFLEPDNILNALKPHCTTTTTGLPATSLPPPSDQRLPLHCLASSSHPTNWF